MDELGKKGDMDTSTIVKIALYLLGLIILVFIIILAAKNIDKVIDFIGGLF